jgi:hypothetical protein
VTWLLITLVLLGCGPAEPDDVPQPFFLRIVCGVQRWLEQKDFRVREDGVDRCSGAARQIRATRERARTAFGKATEPPSDEDAPEEPQ